MKNKEKISITEYRQKHPNCRYCIHGCRDGYATDLGWYCKVRGQGILFKGIRAKCCRMYVPSTRYV